MQMKKIIINADDFGLTKENNEAIKEGFKTGVITATSLIANTDGFDNAVNDILPLIPDIDVGFHFNIVEGKSLSKSPYLCGKDEIFNNSYGQLILKSTNKKFLNAIETEFRLQIEKVLKFANISHVDSHVHTHAIPAIFELISKLSKEYGIKYIRTQKELPYFVCEKSFNAKFAKNIIKNVLLNTFTLKNTVKQNSEEIKTNDYFIGVLYTGFMDEKAILSGLKQIKKDNSVTEIIFHPYVSNDTEKQKTKKSNIREFLITQNPTLKNEIKAMGFEFTDYKTLSKQ